MTKRDKIVYLFEKLDAEVWMLERILLAYKKPLNDVESGLYALQSCEGAALDDLRFLVSRLPHDIRDVSCAIGNIEDDLNRLLAEEE